MATTNLRPDGLHVATNWWTNASSIWAALSDQNGTVTRVKASNFESSAAVALGSASAAIPAGAVINSVRVGVSWKSRDSGATSTGEVHLVVPGHGSYSGSKVARTASDQVVYTDFGPAINGPTVGGAWTVAQLDTAALQLIDPSAPNGADNTVAHVFYEAWLEVTYTVNVAPTVSNVAVASISREKPVVTWSYSDPETNPQTSFQVIWYRSPEATQYHDGGVQAGAGTSYTATVNFSPGLYYATVAAFDGIAWSVFAQSNVFRILNSPLGIL